MNPDTEQVVSKIEAAAEFFAEHRVEINANRMMVTNAVIAVACGVGEAKVRAVRKMIGQAGTRKGYVRDVRSFLQKYPTFQISDAATDAAMKAFRKIHQIAE